MTGSWLDALEERARASLPSAVFEYVARGARDGTSTAEAVAAWRRHRFLPHVLQDVTTVDLTTSVLGTPLTLPAAVAPTTLQRAADPDGEVAMATAVAEAGSLLVLSSNAGFGFDEVGATGVRWWLQAYLPQDRERARPMLDAAVAAGTEAVVLTLDTPVVGTKYHAAAAVWEEIDTDWLRVNLGDAADDPKATDLGPADIAWLRDVTGLPVVVKGVLRPEDARRCVEGGAAAVWVSNHGGRQLDRVAATADCLAGVVAAIPDTEVYVDGGIRSGLDLVTALGLGARAAFLGRQPLYALAGGGAAGVRQLFAELRLEVEESLRLLGLKTPHEASGVLMSGSQTAADLHESKV